MTRTIRDAARTFVLGGAIAALIAWTFVPAVIELARGRAPWPVTSEVLSLVALAANAVVFALLVASRYARGRERVE